MEPLPVAVPASHPPVAPGGGYVGAQACAECHSAEYRHWQGSQHAKAMQPATEQTVLGDFKDASFTYAGITSTFFRRDGKFMVRTDGPQGDLQDYEIAYTFGVYPLQQYLIGFPDGRYQVLGIAWDSRPREQGGQRWFHLYPDQNLTHQDPLHWTGLQQNWNYMCAECHSTNLRKNYDPKLKRFNTTWSEINVVLRSLSRSRRRSPRLGQEGRGLAKAGPHQGAGHRPRRPARPALSVARAGHERAGSGGHGAEPQPAAGGQTGHGQRPDPSRHPPSTANWNCAPAAIPGAGSSGKITCSASRCRTPTGWRC